MEVLLCCGITKLECHTLCGAVLLTFLRDDVHTFLTTSIIATEIRLQTVREGGREIVPCDKGSYF